MGRKKGKQSGSFGSKLKRSNYLSEILQQQYENNATLPVGQIGHAKRRSDSSILAAKRSSSISPPSSSFSLSPSSTSISKRRTAINLNQLRGLIRERILEDRVLDANQRRARLFLTRPITSQQSDNKQDNSHTNCIRRQEQVHDHLRDEIQMIQAGWLLTYDHRSVLAGLQSSSFFNTSLSSSNMIGVHSLENLTIHALASVMRDYVDACGVDYMHGRMAELPGSVIAKLSSKVRDVTDDMAYVLGHHPHVERLVLNGCDDFYQSCSILHEEDEEDLYEYESKSSLGSSWLTTKGLYCMINAENHTLISEKGECKHEEVIDSWESLSLQDEEDKITDLYSSSHVPFVRSSLETMTSWTNNLQRLELRSFHPTDPREFIGFLMKCSKLTHLSLAYSLNSITGRKLLLLEDDINNRKSGTKTILEVLPNLQVLDLHGCRWLQLDILKVFLDRIMRSSDTGSSSSSSRRTTLEMVCIGGCSSYVSRECASLNSKDLPMLCIHPPL